MAKRVTILGSTGSIGRSTLDVIRTHPGEYDVVGLAAGSNATALAEQIAEFRPSYVAIADEEAAKRLGGVNGGPGVLSGAKGLDQLASIGVDIVLCAMVGAVGLSPILSAIEAGNRIALANKEPLVMAGQLIVGRARERGVKVLPVDSEHSAVFQCLAGHNASDVAHIHLTASGGPFYGRPREELAAVTPDEAASHPTWDMGRKISVDSATLMNKGLEVIEAMWLFDVPLERIQVIIHPQSIVHSLVEFTDGSLLAHLGPTDMKYPIEFALTWPDRAQAPMGRLDLAAMPALTFAAPKFDEFPCLAYARECAKAGGTAPAMLNAANEVAVEAFCRGQLEFLGISTVVGETLDRGSPTSEVSLESVVEADGKARRLARDFIKHTGA